MRRGEVWWASLPDPAGSGPGFRRPVLVIQANPFNQSRLATVVIAVITSNLGLAEAPGNVRLSRNDSRLAKASVVNVTQLQSIDRRWLTQRVGSLPGDVLQRVDTGLRAVLAL